jgi:hypothetical protein
MLDATLGPVSREGAKPRRPDEKTIPACYLLILALNNDAFDPRRKSSKILSWPRSGIQTFFWIDEELLELMGCKMIKGNKLALIILIIISSLNPVSCNNNCSINSSQNSVGNASGLYQPPSDNISDTAKNDLVEKFDQLDWLEKVVSIISGTLAIAGILAGFYLWIHPNARNGARRRIISHIPHFGFQI